MRDVKDEDRRAVESLFQNLAERRCFWSVLKHHDIFGCLCTGEASLPALADIVGWTATDELQTRYVSSAAARISFLLWLNIADVNAVLANVPSLRGITTVEAQRYLTDWLELKNFLIMEDGNPRPVQREEFKTWALEKESHAERTIRRITRLVATCYRKAFGGIDPSKEMEIQILVEEELQALHGPRFERFCFRFARFCKLDYALRFFDLLLEGTLRDEPSLRHIIPKPKVELRAQIQQHAEQRVLRNMVSRTCAILHRVVEEYGHLVDRKDRSAPRLGVDFSSLMQPKETGRAICESLKTTPAAALWWIIDEIGVWLYGD